MIGLEKRIQELGLKFNKGQQLAIDTIDGPVVVIAGPGAGKTTMTCARIANIISTGVDPDNILCVTFSKASAIDMDARFNKMFGCLTNKSVTFSTIHSLANKIVQTYYRQNHFRTLEVIKEYEKKYILKEIYINVNGEDSVTDDKIETLAQDLSYIKNKLVKPEMFATLSFSEIKNIDILYNAYQDILKSKNLIDFDDMLVICYELLRDNEDLLKDYQNQYHYIMVDEAQDTSVVQFNILKLISQKRNNICVVGDDDQNIYAWRGAEVENFLNFERLFPGAKKIYIEQNYRSSQNIVEISNDFIKTNTKRYKKELYTNNEKKSHPRIIEVDDELSQIEYIVEDIKNKDLSECAILYRNNFSSLLLVDRLEREGIPYNIKDNKVSFFSHFIVKDIIAMLKLSLDNTDMESFSRIYGKSKLYLSKEHLNKALEIKKEYKNLEQRVVYIKHNLEMQKNDLEHQERYIGKILDDPNSINIVESYKKNQDLYERDFAQYTILKSKLDNIKSLNNVTSIDKLSVFDILLSIEDLKKFQKEGIIRLKQKIEKIKDKDMKNIISYITDSIGYRDYINDNIENLGFSEENANQVLFLLEKLFNKTNNIKEGLNRLNFLKDRILNNEKCENSLSLSTLHGSKGLEWENVYMIDLIDGVIPSFYAIDESENNFDDKELESERRLYYVGLTRAKSSLNLISPRKKTEEKAKKSIFVIETMASINRLSKNPNSSLYDPNYVSTIEVISNDKVDKNIVSKNTTSAKTTKKKSNNNIQQTFDLNVVSEYVVGTPCNFGGDFTDTINNVEYGKHKEDKVSFFEKNKKESIELLGNLNKALNTTKQEKNGIYKNTYLDVTNTKNKIEDKSISENDNVLKIEDLSRNLQISHISFGKGTIENIKGNFVYIVFDNQTETKMFKADKLIERNLIKKIG